MSVDVGGVLADAEHAARELAVYLSHDRDNAHTRGDRSAAEQLHARWIAAGQLAVDLRALNPDSVDATPHALADVRALTLQLHHLVGRLEPTRRVVTRGRDAGATLDQVDVGRGQPPYGYTAGDHDRVPKIEEQRQVQRIIGWHRDGLSLHAIAKRLNAEGIPARRGRWHPQTVARVLDRAGVRKAS